MEQTTQDARTQLNVVVSEDVYNIWKRIIKTDANTKSELLEKMFSHYLSTPPIATERDTLRERHTAILKRLKEVSTERTKLQIALRTIKAELFLRKEGKFDVLINARLSPEVNSQWRDIIATNEGKAQGDILTEMILSWSSVLTVDELEKLDKKVTRK